MSGYDWYVAKAILATDVKEQPELLEHTKRDAVSTACLALPDDRLDYPNWVCEGNVALGLCGVEDETWNAPVADLYDSPEEAMSRETLGLALCPECIERFTDYRFPKDA